MAHEPNLAFTGDLETSREILLPSHLEAPYVVASKAGALAAALEHMRASIGIESRKSPTQ